MPILVHFKAKNNDNSYFYKNSGLSFQWVPYYVKQGYPHYKLRKTFSKFYRRYYDLISKFQIGLKSPFSQALSEPEFYGDLVYKGSLTLAMGKCLWFSVKIKVCQSSLSSP